MPSKTRLLANLISNTGDVKSAGLDNVVTPDTGLEVYSTLDSLPTSNLSAGDQSWVSENNRLYISNGSGWYNLAATNAAPYWDSEPNTTYTIVDSATPLIITALARDSDNPASIITNQSFASDSAAFLVDITRDSSVFTFTPKSEDSIGASVTAGDLTDSGTNDFTYTFKWSDGINFVSKAVTINYNFAATLPAGFIEYELFDDTPLNLVGYTNASGQPFGVTGSNANVTFETSGSSGLIDKNGAYDAGFYKQYDFTSGNTYTFYADGLSLNMGNNRIILFVGTSINGSQKANLGEWTSGGNQSKSWTANGTGTFYVTLRSVTTNTSGEFSLAGWRIAES